MKAIAESKKALAELKNQQAGFQLQIQAIDKSAADARKQAQKEANDKRLADQKEADDKLKKQAEDLQQFYKDQREADNERNVTDRLGERKQTKDRLDLLYEASQEEARIKKEARDAEAIANKQAAQEAIELENQKRTKQLELATSAFSALGDLVGSFSAKNEKDAKKQFKVQKAFNLASAITNTALAITGALTAGGNPIKLATGAQFVEAALAAVTGAASIAKIAGTQFESASSGGGSGAPSQSSGADAGASNIVTPNFNIVGNAQATNPLAGLGGQPLQAYVVSGDVTTAQSLDRNRINYATFG
jgi:hypothetical protein